jgi:hypothetical protein
MPVRDQCQTAELPVYALLLACVPAASRKCHVPNPRVLDGNQTIAALPSFRKGKTLSGKRREAREDT